MVSKDDKDLSTAFARKANSSLRNIDLMDQLLVFGYFRRELEDCHIVIPPQIITFCVIYLFLYTERLFIGNIHESVERSRNKHKWIMFISKSKDKLIKPKTIKYVTYHLHPTFRPNTVRIDKSPFQLQRRGWGTFTVNATITFKTKCRRQDHQCSHHLDFDNHVSLVSIEGGDQFYFHDKQDYPLK